MKSKVIDAANYMVRTLELLNGGALCRRIDRDENAIVSMTNPHIETQRAVTRTHTWYRRWFVDGSLRIAVALIITLVCSAFLHDARPMSENDLLPQNCVKRGQGWPR